MEAQIDEAAASAAPDRECESLNAAKDSASRDIKAAVVAHIQEVEVKDWVGVDPTAVTVSFLAKGSFSSVFKAEAPGCETLAVRLGSDKLVEWGGGIGSMESAVRKALSLRQACEDHGLTVHNFGHATDFSWSVDACGGSDLKAAPMDLAIATQMGQLLARLHAVPTDWYEPFRQQVCSSQPRFSAVPPDSPLWARASANMGLSGGDGIIPQLCELEGAGFETFVRSIPAPRTAEARRVVTLHNDFQPGNVIWSHDRARLFVVDFANASVSCAAVDLWEGCRTVGLVLGAALKEIGQRAFIAGYLGPSVTSEHVDEVLLDVQCCALCRFKLGSGARQAYQQLIDAIALEADVAGWCAHKQAVIDEARADPDVFGFVCGDQAQWKAKLMGGKEWSLVELLSQRLGKQDTFAWWKHCGFQNPDPPGWQPPPPDKMA
jgi:hypothetical protein